MKITHGIFLFNNEKKLLLGHVTNSNSWSIPKGQSEENETAFETTIRELKEETNIVYKKLSVIKMKSNPDIVYKNNKKTLSSITVFTKNTESDFNLVCNSLVNGNETSFPEFDSFKWVTIEDAISMDIHPSQKKILKKML